MQQTKDSIIEEVCYDMHGNEIDAKTGKIIKKCAMMDFAKWMSGK